MIQIHTISHTSKGRIHNVCGCCDLAYVVAQENGTVRETKRQSQAALLGQDVVKASNKRVTPCNAH